ncbi:MAG: polysaccharide deacetylase family protein [Candidatus Eisenbacteria bacterium]|nr:polysaccharide deacetylase family protein [Candidatus Eisenbacteria bacterium]
MLLSTLTTVQSHRVHARDSWRLLWSAFSVGLALARASAASVGPQIAVTIDDLPFVNAVRPGDSRMEATGRILAALEKHHVPATGFVVCDRIPGQEAILRQWMEAGMELGNHSCTHPHLDEMPLGDWAEEVLECTETLTRFTGTRPRWFRYPFLQMGATVGLRDSAVAIVRSCGHSVAQVSVDTGEWALVKPYVDAWRAGDAAGARIVGDAYVDHLLGAVEHYREVARARFGRDIPHVLLLHANALAADYLDTLLTALEGRGVTFVPLADALSDSVYALPDGYAGLIGLSWLYRVAPFLEGAWSWDNAQVDAFGQRFGSRPDPDSCWIDHDMRVRTLSEGIWVVTHEKPWPANSLVAELADSTLLLVDTPYTPAATRSMLQWLTARFGRRPMIAVNTHFHYDAMGGNEALQEAGVPIYGSDLSVRMLAEREDAMRTQVVGWLGQRPEKDWFESLRLVPPDHVFPVDQGLTLVHGDTVKVIHPGPAHSLDNSVVYLPRRRVLFGGCMLLCGDRVGNTADADLAAWPAAVERLRELPAVHVVPGHGNRFTQDLLDHTLRVLAASVR